MNREVTVESLIKQEGLFKVSFLILKKMFEKNIINFEEYERAKKELVKIYRPKEIDIDL